MSSRIRHFSFVASLAALIIGGSAAVASPSLPNPPPRPTSPTEPGAWSAPGLGYLHDVLGRSSSAPAVTGAAPGPGRISPAAKPGRKDPHAGLPAGAFAGYATATVFHTDPELASDNEGDAFGAEYDLGLSDAAHASVPVPAVTDELGRKAIPALEAGHSFGQGQGVKLPKVLEDIDLDIDPSPAVAKAPPSRTPVKKSTQGGLGFVKADAFEAEARARAIPTGCVIGDDLARGVGSAIRSDVDPDGDFDDEDAPLLSVSVDDPPPPRAVSQSISRVALSREPVTPGYFGGIAETRLTVAPITFGLPGETRKDEILFTLELAGEFVLRAAADGQKGKLFFGPDGTDETHPVARLFRNGKEIGGAGFGEIVPIEVGDEVVGEIRIGDDPHAIGNAKDDPTTDGTRVSAAADVAVVRFFAVGAAQQRVGHMEVDLTVPSDGVACPGITLSKRSDPASVTPGTPFTFTIDVANPNDCVLSAVKVKDAATTEPGVAWKVLTTLPRSTISKEGVLAFDLESLRPGERKTIRINAESAADSKPGTVTNQATAAGVCSKVPLSGGSTAVATIRSAVPPAAPLPSPPPSAPSPPANPAAGSASTRTGSQAPAPDTPRAGTSGASKSRSSSGVLARTGASLPIAVAVPLIVGGRVLRRLRRVRRTEES
jgi:hypothetical protein